MGNDSSIHIRNEYVLSTTLTRAYVVMQLAALHWRRQIKNGTVGSPPVPLILFPGASARS